MEKYYLELPEEYKLDKTIDAKSLFFSIVFTIGSLIITVLTFFLIYKIKFNPLIIPEDSNKLLSESIIAIIIIGLGSITYIILHELTHGVFYKYFTKQKLTFGLTLTVAYCGVPNVYVRKKEAIISCLAPLVIYSIIFILLIIILPPNIINMGVTFLFSLHIGGCIGDIFLSLVLLIKYDKDTYIRDTGPTQYIYKKIQ